MFLSHSSHWSTLFFFGRQEKVCVCRCVYAKERKRKGKVAQEKERNIRVEQLNEIRRSSELISLGKSTNPRAVDDYLIISSVIKKRQMNYTDSSRR